MMNPIFSRRYKQGSRPNIMPTSAKRQNYMKSMSSAATSASNSSQSSSGGSAMSTFSMGDSVEDTSPGDMKSPEKEDHPFFTKSTKNKGHGMQATSPGDSAATSSRALAQQLLASKQNMLAQMSLTPQENRQREKLSSGGGPKEEKMMIKSSVMMKQSFSTENFSQITTGQNNSSLPKSPTVHEIASSVGDMKLSDVEDLDLDPTSTSYHQSIPTMTVSDSRIARPNLNQRINKEPLDMKIWYDLKQIVTGTGSFMDGWIGQGFAFDTRIPFGLVQKKGGPCGVLAVVQSLIIRNLLFGSPFSEAGQTEKKKNLEEMAAYLSCGGTDPEMKDVIRKCRVDCLVDAIAEILWICGEYAQNQSEQERSSLIMFSDYRVQPEVICVKGRSELQQFLQNSIHRFDCIALVYSAVLTRGIEGVKEDMDFENSFVGQHGYCSQELINLLCIGRAFSNTFDNDIELDGKILKGIPSRCDIGLLSLFEHYGSIQVGKSLKFPRFPIWMICSESHYTVLFSSALCLCTDDEEEEDGGMFNTSFDLFYYDGLARQDKVIRLSIYIPAANNLSSLTCGGATFNPLSDDNQPSTSSSTSAGGYAFRQEDLIPPLEKCIRTKWHGALVDWNDSEPLL